MTRYTLADPAFPNVPIVQKCRDAASHFPSDYPDGTCVGDGSAQDMGAGPLCDKLATLTDAARADVDARCVSASNNCTALVKCLKVAAE